MSPTCETRVPGAPWLVITTAPTITPAPLTGLAAPSANERKYA